MHREPTKCRYMAGAIRSTWGQLGLVLLAAGWLLTQDRQAEAGRSRAQGVHPDVQVRHVLNTGTQPRSVRLAKDPRDGTLFYVKTNGQISRLDLAKPGSTPLYDAGDHGVSGAQGFAIGPDGAMYLVGNEDRPGAQTRATIAVGVPQGKHGRSWSVLARTADYPKSNTAFDHRFNGIVVDSRGRYVYVNSGSRTDHGEVQDAGGLHARTREVGLTAAIFRLPARSRDLLLPNDRAALKAAGYVFAEGTRNSFDFAFDRKGKLYAPDNGPDRDMADELNVLRQGGHYGFPWRIGGADNPQQFPNYDPDEDRLLDPRFYAVQHGYYDNDPAFPARPQRRLIEPLANRGPHADSYRDPATGEVEDASDNGRVLRTFTTHRSPLGLVFDTRQAMGGQFRGGGFILGWTQGDSDGDDVAGPFHDPSQDLLHLAIVKGKKSPSVRVTRVADGFSNPIDAEVIENRIYVLEYGGNGGLWEVTLPQSDRSVRP